MLLGILDELLGHTGPQLGLYVVFHESVAELVQRAVCRVYPASVTFWLPVVVGGWAYCRVLAPCPEKDEQRELSQIVASYPHLVGAHWFGARGTLGWTEGVC